MNASSTSKWISENYAPTQILYGTMTEKIGKQLSIVGLKFGLSTAHGVRLKSQRFLIGLATLNNFPGTLVSSCKITTLGRKLMSECMQWFEKTFVMRLTPHMQSKKIGRVFNRRDFFLGAYLAIGFREISTGNI